LLEESKQIGYLTSAPFACGIGWLVNCLTALDYKTISLVYGQDTWEMQSDGSETMPARVQAHLRNHLPVLFERSEFRFKPSVELYWEHRICFPLRSNAPVVVVMRDPRDAIFSLYRRWRENDWIDLDYQSFLAWRSDWPDHFPGMYFTNPILTFLLFNLVWLKARKFRKVMFLRFEEFKTNPSEELLNAIEHLNLEAPTDLRIREAQDSSDTRSAREKMDRESSLHDFKAIHKGLIYEWKSAYDPAWLNHFASGPVRACIRYLGYESAPSELEAVVRKIVEKRCATLSLAIRFWFFDRVRDSRHRVIRRMFMRQSMKRIAIAALWGVRTSSLPRDVLELRSFYFKLGEIILPSADVDFIVERLYPSLGWSVDDSPRTGTRASPADAPTR